MSKGKLHFVPLRHLCLSFLYTTCLPPYLVPNIYFWRLKSISPQGFIEGNPAFRVHGTVQPSDGGVAFDGQSGFLTTDMASTDCVMDPALCMKGLSIGMNLKFDQSMKDYKEPRYLIDTGAQSSQTRGVSMYVKDGKIYFKLAISQKVWEVRCKQFEMGMERVFLESFKRKHVYKIIIFRIASMKEVYDEKVVTYIASMAWRVNRLSGPQRSRSAIAPLYFTGYVAVINSSPDCLLSFLKHDLMISYLGVSSVRI